MHTNQTLGMPANTTPKSTHSDSIKLKGPCSWPRWVELLATLAVCAGLIFLAQPLATPGADMGLGHRYADAIQPAYRDWFYVGALAPLSWDWLFNLHTQHLWTALPQNLRAVAMLRSAGYALALVGIGGWLALQWVRKGSAWSCALALALWAVLGWVLRPYQLPGALWAALLAGLALAGLAATLRAVWRRYTSPAPAPINDRAQLNFWIACVWPGWLALVGVGCLVAMDFGARGPVVAGYPWGETSQAGARYFGLYQFDAFFLSSGLLLAVVALRARLLRLFFHLSSLLADVLQRPRGPWLLAALGLLLALAAGWLGLPQRRDFLGIPGLHGGGYSHISGEALRLLACAALAWFAYRSGEWRTSPERLWAGLRRLLATLTICGAGLYLSDDKGPLLILALAMSVLIGVPLVHRLSTLAGARGTALVVVIITFAALGVWRTALVDWLPGISTDGNKRGLLRTQPYAAMSPNLAQARWLMDAAPPMGFGLARVPYCGASAHAGRSSCTLSSGSPLQMPSDFAYVPLVATWGHWGAGGLVAGLLVWLFALTAGQLQAWRAMANTQAPMHTAAHTRNLLPVWLVAVPCLAAQAQVVVSVGGTLGWSLVTGVPLPLLGYGGVSLCVIALWVGLAAHAKRV